MIEDLRNHFPEEIVWNILKYTSHPCANLIRDFVREKN